MNENQLICKICGSHAKPLHDPQFDQIYMKCTNCGFIHLMDQYHISYESERAEYDLHENSIDDLGYVKYLDNFLSQAVDPFVTSGRALDFGCGPGPVLAELMKQRGLQALTYDRHYQHSEDALDHVYDLITATEVFEHFHDPVSEMALMSSLLKKNGVLSIMTSVPPNSESEFLKWGYRREQTHISFYTLKSLECLGRRFGFEILIHDNKRVTVFRKIV